MSVLPAFDLIRPATLEEALGAVSTGAIPYAGGTELLLAMRAGLLRPPTLVDLKRVPPLVAIETGDDGGFTLGGSVTHNRAIRHQGLMSSIPVLGEVLAKVGNPRVRSAGTLGGNLCFAEPKSDVITLLIALQATLDLHSPEGRRAIPVRDFFLGPYTTVRQEDELLAAITLFPTEGTVVYEKFQTMERPTVGVASTRLGDGSVHLVVGSVGPIPESFAFASMDAVEPDEVASAVEVIPDMTGGDRYKRHVTAITIRRALRRLEEKR